MERGVRIPEDGGAGDFSWRGLLGGGIEGVEMDAQRPGMLARGFGKGLQFLQGEVGFAHLQPILRAADGDGVAQRQTGVGELVEAKVQLFGRRFGLGASVGGEGEDGGW